MAKRPTPIERYIEGSSANRQRRYLDRLEKQGFTRMTVTVPYDRRQDVLDFIRQMRAQHEARND